MITKIIVNLIAFVLFTYIFLFKMIKKNDTAYISVLIIQAIGILISLLQTSIEMFDNIFLKLIVYITCIIFPLVIFLIESKGINYLETTTIIRAKVLLYKKNNKKAKELLIILISRYPNSYYGHKILAQIYAEEGGMRKAIDEYVKVLDIKGDDYQTYFKISKLLKDLEKKDEAAQMLKTLVNKKPELYEANMLLGEILDDIKRYKEAINIYKQYLKYDERYEVYFRLGKDYIMVNDFIEAKKSLENAVRINNKCYKAFYTLGQISLLYRDFELAETYFLQSIYEEFEAKSYYQLAKIYIIKNNTSKTIIYLNKAIEINPSYYKFISEEPIFFNLKNQIQKNDSTKEIQNEEKDEIEQYLEEVYELTKTMNKKMKKHK